MAMDPGVARPIPVPISIAITITLILVAIYTRILSPFLPALIPNRSPIFSLYYHVRAIDLGGDGSRTNW